MKLADKIEDNFRLDINQKKALHRLKIFSVADLLHHFPVRYSEISIVKNISELIAGEMATVYGKVSKLKTKKGFRSKIPMAEGLIEDVSGKIRITWFHQAYLAKMLHDGEQVKLTGKIAEGKNGIYLTNPEFEKVPHMPIDSHDSLFTSPSSTPPENFSNDKAMIARGVEKNSQVAQGLSYPVYAETRGITSKWFYHAVQKIFKAQVREDIEDPIPEDILKKYNLPTLKTALVWIHTPRHPKDAEAARKRFAFEEVLTIQLRRQRERAEYKHHKSFQVMVSEKSVGKFLKRFPFKPTRAQEDAIATILKDMSGPRPMSRLLEGDVGSGKTAVAATATHAIVENGLQVAYMAPTEILANQHFHSFIKYFVESGIQVGLITGSGCKKFPSKINPAQATDISRSQLLKWVSEGVIPVLIGTHALIQKSVKFKNLALAVIDEQHRFGTAQRRKLVRKDGIAPHLLSMTATPIPRTLALTIYGDLDLSLLDEMPAGRKQVETSIVTPDKREGVYEKIREELASGRQAYVICPRIDHDEEKAEMKSVTMEAKRLKKDIFPNYEIGILHSRMNKVKKDKVMEDFSSGKIQILCATSVVEVGVNVPNATVIIIEGAEHYGLAQLHQLRGRVLRSNHQAYCYIFAESKSDKTIKRLNAIKSAKSGFELAELDLALRGAGELAGAKQWGISDLGMEAIKNIKMVEAARTEAVRLISESHDLAPYPLLQKKVAEKSEDLHFE